MKLARRAWFALAILAALAACSGTPKPKPTPLEALVPQIGGRMVWSQRIAKVDFPLQVAVNRTASSGGTFKVAASEGTLLELQADTGTELWRTNVGVPLAAGVGSDGRTSAVVSRDNELIVVESGRIVWRTRLGARVGVRKLPFKSIVRSRNREQRTTESLGLAILWRYTLKKAGRYTSETSATFWEAVPMLIRP